MKKCRLYIITFIMLINIFTFSGLFSNNCLAKSMNENDIKVSIVSPGNKSEIYEGEKLGLGKIIKDSLGNIIEKEVLWESLNPQIAIVDQRGLVIGVKEGTTKIKLEIKDNKNYFVYFDLKVTHKEQVNKKDSIKEALANISNYYKEEIKVDYLPAMATRMITKEFGIDADNFKDIMIHPDKGNFTAEDIINKANTIYCSENIMSIISAGKDPYEYECKDVKINFVDMLIKSQNKDGQFVILEGLDKDNIKSLSYAIIALDMVGEKYDEESAVKALIKLNKEKKYMNVNFGEIGYKAISITALNRHKDINGVKEFIDECLKEFKRVQNDEGGFNGAKSKINSSVTTAMVIQALIANDIDPLSWSNAGKTMLDAILDHQKENGTFIDANGENNTDYRANDQCYAALSELYTGKSMYKTIKSIKKKDFKIELLGENKFRNGQDIDVEVKVTSNINKDKQATLIVQVYDKDLNRMIKYSYINKNIEARCTENLRAGLNISHNGRYMVKILVWDNMENINPIVDMVKVDVFN